MATALETAFLEALERVALGAPNSHQNARHPIALHDSDVTQCAARTGGHGDGGTKMGKQRTGSQWSQTEWTILAMGAEPHLAAGVARSEAAALAQELLPPGRRVPKATAKHRAAPSMTAFTRALDRWAKMSPTEQREFRAKHTAAPVLPEVPKAKPDALAIARARLAEQRAAGTASGLTRWNDEEAARLARRIRHWQSTQHSHKRMPSLALLFARAQEIELPPERRRPRTSLQAGSAAKLPKLMARGLAAQGLLKHVPFVPDAMTYAQAIGLDITPSQAAQPAPAPEAPPSPEKTLQAPAEALAAVMTPAPAPGSNTHELARWVGVSMANAMVPLIEAMLDSHERTVMARMQSQVQGLHDGIIASVSQQVLAGLDRMLGGTGQVPPVAPPEALLTEPLADIEAKPKRVKIDVVGFEQGAKEMLVTSQLNGHAQHVDLSFIHPDKANTYAPHRDRNVILILSRIPHSLKHKLAASGCNVINTQRTVGHVVKEINKLVEARGQ